MGYRAGGLIVQEAGGKVTDLQGGPQFFTEPWSLIAANPKLHAQILAVLHEDSPAA